MARLTDTNISMLSKHFKQLEDSQVTRINNRIVGVCPEAVEEYFRSVGHTYFYKPSILLSANLCGGVGKTTSIYNLGIASRRITNRKTPIVYVDGDSQGSFTSIVFGNPADDKDPILIDFLEKKAEIKEVLTEIGDNIWFVKSNLNQAFIDKTLSKPQELKKGMLRFYEEIFSLLGNDTKIFQDHTPQLSTLFASSICALNQLNNEILKGVIIPIRADKFAIQGAEYILKEINELTDTFSLQENIKKYCFFSSLDRRVSTTGDALKLASSKAEIIDNLSPVGIRYSVEIPKSIMSSANVYSSGKTNNAAEDYQDLLQNIFRDS